MNNPCTICGESDIVCLEFHHTKDKMFNVGSAATLITAANIDVLKKEIEKCVVLCANCHRKEHARMRTLNS